MWKNYADGAATWPGNLTICLIRSEPMQLSEHFLGASLPRDFSWFNEPRLFRLGNGLEIFTDEKTDFWQRTHYGFQRDDGHCLLIRQTDDFSLMTHIVHRSCPLPAGRVACNE
jgi:hypothetical protein